MKSKTSYYIFKHLDAIVIFALCLCLFSYLLLNIATDMNTHINQIIRINTTSTQYPANFIFYALVNLLSGFSTGKILYAVTIVVLSIACVAKYLISKSVIVNLINNKQEGLLHINSNYLMAIAIGLFFCFAIPDPFSIFVLKKMYLSKFVPTVWHNSTTILLFPFSILLFFKQLELFNLKYQASTKDIIIINALIVANLLIKPSFIFAYAPVTLLFLLQKYNSISFKNFILQLTPLFTTALVLIIQYYFIFIKQNGSFFNDKSELAISTPFQMLLNFVPWWFIPFSFILSFALILIAIINYKEILNYFPFRYAVALLTVSIIISAFVVETGPRALHGNFLWQNVICTYLLFLVTIVFLTPILMKKQQWSSIDKVMVGVFFIHVLSGILYPIKIILTTSYY